MLGGTCVAWTCGASAVDLLACPASLPPAYTCIASTIVGPAAELFGAPDPSNANLTHAQLLLAHANGARFSGAALDRAHLHDAQLLGSTWSSTICPDGTNSSSNGSAPRSCCTHQHLGGIPAACSP